MKMTSLVTIAGLLACAGAANAQFTGSWDHSNWGFSSGGDGSVTNKTATTVTVIGNDNTVAGNTDYCITVPAGSWTVSFDWAYISSDSGTFDSGGYVLNGVYTALAFNNSGVLNGNVGPLNLNGGDTLCFRVFSADGIFGPGTFEVSAFSAVSGGGGCYPDCDGDGILTIDDFICFQTLFALGDPYADCDEDTNLTIDDFICFQTLFAIGC